MCLDQRRAEALREGTVGGRRRDPVGRGLGLLGLRCRVELAEQRDLLVPRPDEEASTVDLDDRETAPLEIPCRPVTRTPLPERPPPRE